MARITIEYDKKSVAARSIVEMIYKSGLFKIKDDNFSLTDEEAKFSKELRQALKEAVQ